MSKVSEWILTEPAHVEFAKYVSIERNKKMVGLNEMFAKEGHVSFTRYFAEAAKCKSLAQWKGRMLAVELPEDSVHGVRNQSDCGRLLALKFMEGLETVPTADLKSRDHWITPELSEWMA